MALWRFLQPPPAYSLRITQLTFDPGLTGWPAISPDGLTVAYVSDRDTGNNLELYVQPARGGSPVRLTSDSTNWYGPVFSPDASSLAISDGVGIYTVPVAGGQPHLLAASGRSPQYSPDGRWITYSDAEGARIIASTGGTGRPFHPELHIAGTPAWSPDGKKLIFWTPDDLKVAPLEGGTVESTGIGPHLTKAGLAGGPYDDTLWTGYGLIFSARTEFARNLYLCPLGRDGQAGGNLVQLTNGTDLIGNPSISREGRLVFSSGRQRFDIWGVPLDSASGKAKGPAYRITNTLAPTANPDLSADGKRLIFGSSHNGFTEIWEKDLTTGKERVAVTGPEGASYGRLLKSSSEILHVRPAAGRNEVYIGNHKLTVAARPWDANRNATNVLVSGSGIEQWNVQTGALVPVISAPAPAILSDASFSPDDRWVVFVETAKDHSQVYALPAQGGKWRQITKDSAKAGKPRFSPDGGLIYFTLDRDGSREIDAVRFDTRSGEIAGEPFAVFRSEAPRLSLLLVNPQALDIAVGRDKLATIFCEQSSTIWLGDLVLH